MERHGAVVSSTDGDAVRIQYLRDVMRVDACQVKRDHTAPKLGRWSKNAHAGYLFQSLDGIFDDFMLVSGNRFHTYLVEIIYCRSQTDSFGNCWRPRFKFMG